MDSVAVGNFLRGQLDVRKKTALRGADMPGCGIRANSARPFGAAAISRPDMPHTLRSPPGGDIPQNLPRRHLSRHQTFFVFYNESTLKCTGPHTETKPRRASVHGKTRDGTSDSAVCMPAFPVRIVPRRVFAHPFHTAGQYPNELRSSLSGERSRSGGDHACFLRFRRHSAYFLRDFFCFCLTFSEIGIDYSACLYYGGCSSVG